MGHEFVTMTIRLSTMKEAQQKNLQSSDVIIQNRNSAIISKDTNIKINKIYNIGKFSKEEKIKSNDFTPNANCIEETEEDKQNSNRNGICKCPEAMHYYDEVNISRQKHCKHLNDCAQKAACYGRRCKV
ncbi:hypothetical protein NPIL_8391 [Nephila pilipes]|uniref:Uncharacterized protein n=1 Tax=Nephila pilipes TaxID=299642 RepID=A0A8X6UCZ3_NEPPI|nr:hypothetical protein NPIL_8391 [Nephila pilipes]